MNRDECDFCGLTMFDLVDEYDYVGEDGMSEFLFEASLDGKQMACAGCAIGREGFWQWEPDLS